jgi:HTH-type transcriptional regulator/antitoxin MqsA
MSLSAVKVVAMSNNICPVCAEGHLNGKIESRLLEHNRVGEEVAGFKYSVCDFCGTVVTNSDQSKANKRIVLAFRKRIDGLLSGGDVRRIRNHFGLNQRNAAKIFGGGAVAFSKYENDDVAQSASMDKLLRVAFAVPEAYRWLYSNAGFDVAEGFAMSFEFEFRFDSSARAERRIASQYSECTVLESNQGAANVSDLEDAAQSA